MLFAHKHFSLSDRLTLRDAMNLDTISGLLGFLAKVIRGTVIVELTGALFYAIAFVPRFGFRRGIWVSFFTAVSAFCNAGIDILGPNSLIPFRDDPLILIVTMALIVTGGLGYVVWVDIFGKTFARQEEVVPPKEIFRHFTEHTKLALTLTLALIAAGTAVIFAAEFRNPETIGTFPLPLAFLNSLFESVTFRTAGFAAIPQGSLTDVSCIAAFLLMFIGGSPIGTAGGIKTTTFYFYILNIMTYIRGENSAYVYKRSISREQMMKATAIVEVSMGTVLALTFLLTATNPFGFTDSLFEVMSACATVGLTRGITPLLNTAGKLIIIAGMYLGRIGPISMALFLAGGRKEKTPVHFPEGNFFIG